MRHSTFASPELYSPTEGASGNILMGIATRFMQGWRAARADRLSAADLGHLDSETLRDLGVESDEICRLHSGQNVMPRSWQA